MDAFLIFVASCKGINDELLNSKKDLCVDSWVSSPGTADAPAHNSEQFLFFVKIQSIAHTMDGFDDTSTGKSCCWIYFQISFTHPGLRRLVAEEGSTTVTLARVLPSLRETRADHGVGNSVPGRIIAFWERHNLSFLPAGSVRGVAILVAYHRD